MGLRIVCVLGLALTVMVQNSYGLSTSVKTKLMNKAIPFIKECAEELEISNEQVEDMKKDSHPEEPCFLACYFKKIEVMDDDGMFSAENAVKLLKEITEGESKEDAEKLEETALKCASVNEEQVEDGTKGCDRAILLHKCFHSQLA